MKIHMLIGIFTVNLGKFWGNLDVVNLGKFWGNFGHDLGILYWLELATLLTRRMATPGTRTGSSSFFQICYMGGDEIMLAVSMYHMHIELFPVLVPGVAVLIVHLDPQYGLCHPCHLEIWISYGKVACNHA